MDAGHERVMNIGNGQWAMGSGETACRPRPTFHSPLPTAHCPLTTAYCLLPAVPGPRPTAGRPRPAFTLPELLVALVILIIILGITGAIYKSASDAVTMTNATVSIQQRADAFRHHLEQDLAGINKDGYLILIRRNFSNLKEVDSAGRTLKTGLTARSDQVAFWRTGNFQSFTPNNPPLTSNLGYIFYSHAKFTPSSPAELFGEEPDNGGNVNRWLLSRKNRIYIPGVLGTPNNDLWGRMQIGMTFMDRTFGLDMLYLNQAANQGAPWFTSTIRSWIDLFCIPTMSNLNNDYYLMLGENCGSVSIRYLLSTEDANHNGALEGNENNGYTTWPPDNGDDTNPDPERNVWLELPGVGESCSPGNLLNNNITVDGVNLGVVVFAPGGALWPKALEVTVRVYDPALSVQSRDEEIAANGRHGGLTYKFVVPLPD